MHVFTKFKESKDFSTCNNYFDLAKLFGKNI